MGEKGKAPEPKSAGRRKAVKTIVGGVATLAAYNILPTRWGTPILEQVILPAHAQMSMQLVGNFIGTVTEGNITSITPTDQNYIAKIGNSISEFFVSEAHAQTGYSAAVCVEISGSTVSYTLSDGRDCIQVSGPVSGQATTGNIFTYTFEILGYTSHTVTVQVTIAGEGSVVATGVLETTTEACECIEAVDRE